LAFCDAISASAFLADFRPLSNSWHFAVRAPTSLSAASARSRINFSAFSKSVLSVASIASTSDRLYRGEDDDGDTFPSRAEPLGDASIISRSPDATTPPSDLSRRPPFEFFTPLRITAATVLAARARIVRPPSRSARSASRTARATASSIHVIVSRPIPRSRPTVARDATNGSHPIPRRVALDAAIREIAHRARDFALQRALGVSSADARAFDRAVDGGG
jgi:hypothetical protein